MAPTFRLQDVAVAITAVSVAAAVAAFAGARFRKKRQQRDQCNDATRNCSSSYDSSYEYLIGNTPLVKLTKLSALIGNDRSIYAKMECANPGGTGKDRAALRMIQDKEIAGELPPPIEPSSQLTDNVLAENPSQICELSTGRSDDVDESINLAIARSRTGGIVVEGTSGSTGISLASLCAVRGHSAIVVMPDDQALEKRNMLKCLGAIVHVVPNAAISNPNQYVNVARRIASRINERKHARDVKAAFINQFENLSNYSVHNEWTGPELWRQTQGKIDAFVMSSGTGGTISGVGSFLKKQNANVKVCLVDPPGSALYSKIKHGVAFAPQQSERSLRRHRYDTLAEGIGLDRITANFSMGCESYGDDGSSVIGEAIRVSDQEAVDMAHWLLREEGVFVGSSSAMNIVGAVRVATSMPSHSVIVTVVCDGGQRHVSRFWNQAFIEEWGLSWPGGDNEKRLPECIASIKL